MSTPNRDRAWVIICNEIKKALSNISDDEQHVTESTKHATESTKQWLSLIDTGKFAEGWKTAAEYFQTAVTSCGTLRTFVGI